MAETSWPSPNHGTPARAVTDAEYQHLAPWASDGLFPSNSDVVYANSSGREVHVRAGKYGIVRGHAWASGSTERAVTIGANTSGSTRIDTAVLRLDRSTWDVTLVVRAGTPGSGSPALQRDSGDSGQFEIPVADITVANGAAAIAAGDVRARTLWQASGSRACTVITDVQAELAAGDIVYEASTGRWLGWTGSSGTVIASDSGWRSLTLVNKFTAGSLALRARQVSGVCCVKGNAIVPAITSSLGGNAAENPIEVCKLPANSGLAPNEQHVWAAPIGQSAVARMRMDTDGVVAITAMVDGELSKGQGVYIDTAYLLG